MAKERLFTTLFSGMDYEKLRYKAEEFANVLDRNLSPQVFSKLKEMQERDALTVILSASPGFWIRPWAERHGISDVIATEIEVINDTVSGKFATPNCKGSEKIRRFIEKYPSRTSYILSAWGNSNDDLPFLSFADFAYKI